VIKSEPL